jgi:hypothetical protein
VAIVIDPDAEVDDGPAFPVPRVTEPLAPFDATDDPRVNDPLPVDAPFPDVIVTPVDPELPKVKPVVPVIDVELDDENDMVPPDVAVTCASSTTKRFVAPESLKTTSPFTDPDGPAFITAEPPVFAVEDAPAKNSTLPPLDEPCPPLKETVPAANAASAGT